MQDSRSLISREVTPEDEIVEVSLRPATLSEYIGQQRVKDNPVSYTHLDVYKRQMLPEANLKPRLRMAVLYYFANLMNYMVVGTTNKPEWFVGYFTKYGDGGVDMLPLADLKKAEVRELARFLGVPDRIIEKAPSGGLWEGQTDEKEMGLKYEDLDAYVSGKKVSPQVESRILDMHLRTEHKRNVPPMPHVGTELKEE